MEAIFNVITQSYDLAVADLSCLSVVGTVEGGSGRLELGVGLVSFFQDLLSFISGQAFLSCELEGLESGMSGACLHLSITCSLLLPQNTCNIKCFSGKRGIRLSMTTANVARCAAAQWHCLPHWR